MSEYEEELKEKVREDKTLEESDLIKREHPDERCSDLYFESDRWDVVDIDFVDNSVVTPSIHNCIRMDIDGICVNDDYGSPEKGVNINTSIWLGLGEAIELVKQINQALAEKIELLEEESE